MALATLPGLILYAGAAAGWAWFNQLSLQMGGFGAPAEQGLWILVGLVTIFAGCFWSADMYRKALPEAGTRSLFGDAGRLFLASLAVYLLYFILLFLLTLFSSIFAGILIGAAGYDPSAGGNSPETVRQSIEALSGSGGAVVLYLLLFAAAGGLVWLGLRLFLFGAATVAERRITIFRSWPWTSHHVARIALLWLSLQLVPWMILFLAISAGAHGAGLFTAPGEGAPGAPTAALVTGAAVLAMAPFYWLGHGLAVALYTRLAPNRVDAETTFG